MGDVISYTILEGEEMHFKLEFHVVCSFGVVLHTEWFDYGYLSN